MSPDMKLLKIKSCSECKYYTWDGWVADARCTLTCEQLTDPLAISPLYDGILNDPVNIYKEFGKLCPLENMK